MAKDFSYYCNFIFVCNGGDCKENGCKALQKALSQELKSHQLHKTTKIIKTKCTGRCKEGPVVIVKDFWLTNVKAKDTDEIIAKLKK